MSDPGKVIRVGTDTSGRPIYMSQGLKAVFDEVCRRAKVTPTIVQGAYMRKVGGGASASAGTHDGGACIDTRTWDITTRQRRRLIREGRKAGFQAVWFRNQAHGGFDEHMHWNYGGDDDATGDARWQWGEYKAGRDGLASRGRDYHWRPNPIPTIPYRRWLNGDDDMPYLDWPKKDRDALARDVAGDVVKRLLDKVDLYPHRPKKRLTIRTLFARLAGRK